MSCIMNENVYNILEFTIFYHTAKTDVIKHLVAQYSDQQWI